jgi:hypothetical protein
LQAFRLFDHVYGLQFHLEADRKLIRRWVSSPQHIADLARLGIEFDVAGSGLDSERHLPRAADLGQAVFGAFIDRFYGFRRRRAHLSR